MDVLEKYINIRRELMEKGKTGHECGYCGNTKIQTNRFGDFCAGCGIEKHKQLATCFSVPVFDLDDYVELSKLVIV
jgi:hypothetical protein